MRKLVLLGGGHAHVFVLAALAREPLANCEVTLVSPYARQVYSGMLPGWISGFYALDECVIPLEPLTNAAKVKYVQAAAVDLDPRAKRVRLDNGDILEYTWLSVDTGPVPNLDQIPGTRDQALPLRPIERFIQGWEIIAQRARTKPGARVAIIGAGAAGVEIALAVRHALADANVTVVLASATPRILPEFPVVVAARLMRRLLREGIAVLPSAMATAIEPGRVHLNHGNTVAAEYILVATGTTAAKWPEASGIACDERGFILTNDLMQSVSHPEIFAAGDCATMQEHQRPRSGVYAVRAGPPLAQNLRRTVNGQALQRYLPQKNSLYLVSCGSKYAVASWGNHSFEGRLAWYWKDFIDRGFVRKYRKG